MFHATVFSIIFHRPFFTINNTMRGSSRFESLLEMVGLENRIIYDVNDISTNDISTNLNWNDVDGRISKMRLKSIKYLKDNLR